MDCTSQRSRERRERQDGPDTIVYNHLNQPRELVKGGVIGGLLAEAEGQARAELEGPRPNGRGPRYLTIYPDLIASVHQRDFSTCQG
jgi:hypothetical protein